MRGGQLVRLKPYKVRQSGGAGGAVVNLSPMLRLKPGDEVWQYLMPSGDVKLTRRDPDDEEET